jgi:hypothetical protein
MKERGSQQRKMWNFLTLVEKNKNLIDASNG